jgi:hypothetical protein
MGLYERIQMQGGEQVFILGMAKNTGKTNTLNHVISQSAHYSEKLGLTSTGRDGEVLDLVTGKAKPRIYCPRGTIIATAHDTLHVGTATLRDMELTRIDTPLGKVVIAEVAQEGFLELAGPSYARDLQSLLGRMAERGAQRIFVDGSMDRKAAGSVLDQIILTVGAVVSPYLDVVVDEAVTWVRQICIPPVPAWVCRAITKMTSESGGLIMQDGDIYPFPYQSLLGRGRELATTLNSSNAWGVYVAGALGEDTFHTLLKSRTLPRLVIRNATSLFASTDQWQQFLDRGGEIYATHPLHLLAVTVNPYSPEGWEFPPDEFLQAIKEALHPVVVINPGPWEMV